MCLTDELLHVFQDQVVNCGEVSVEDAFLEGHLGITRELLSFQSSDKKYLMGSEKGGANLIKVRTQNFVE